MKRGLVATFVLAGCGRVGFDPVGSDAGPDGGIPTRPGAYQITQARSFGTPGFDHVYGVSVSSAGDVTIAGEIAGPVDFGGGPLTAGLGTIFAASFDATGAHRWSRSFGSSLSVELAITGDAAGVYLTGAFSGTVNFGGASFMAVSEKPFIAALDPDGAHRWSFRPSGAFLLGSAIAVSGGLVAITGDGDGNPWNFGGADLTSTSTSIDMFVAAYRTSDGGHVWSRRLFDPGASFVEGNGVSGDGSGGMYFIGRLAGNVDLGGSTLTGAFDEDAFVVHYSPTGNPMSSRRFGSTDNDDAHAIATAPDGSLIVAGALEGPADLGGGQLDAGASATFVTSMTATGAHRWSRAFPQLMVPVAIETIDTVTYVAATFSGTIDLGGGPITSAGGTDLVVAAFDDSGELVWSERIGGAANETLGDLTRGPDGAMYLVGGFEGMLEVAGQTLTSEGDRDAFAVSLTPAR